MRSELTPAVTRALDAARRSASQDGSSTVEPIHLLLGLIAEEEGRAAMLLRDAGLDLETLRQSLPGHQESEVRENLSLSARSQEILDHAGDIIGKQSIEGSLSTEQLLLSLLKQDVSLRERLESLGLSWSRLEAEMVPEQVSSAPLDESLHLEDITERIDLARVLDSSANRCREGLRVVEDYCRFVLDDAFLTSELKRMRHDLVEALTNLGPSATWSIAARETLRDVGTSLTTSREQHRSGLLAVVQANLKRLQESLRSLEEFGKVHSPSLGQSLEQLRYRTYTLERAIVLGASARERLANARLYVLVTGSLCSAALDWTIQEAAAGGAQIIQLREKNLPDRQLVERACEVRRETRQAGVLFIMNDRADIARLSEADGVHLGQDDMQVKEARRILGPDALIGVSTHNLDQVRQAILDGASYLGVGPTFPSGTKDFAEFAGLDFVRQAMAETTLPAFVLGGIDAKNLPQAIAAGARRVAVSQAICGAEEPRQVAADLRRMLDEVFAKDDPA